MQMKLLSGLQSLYSVGPAMTQGTLVHSTDLFCSTSSPLTGTKWSDQCIRAFPPSKKCQRNINNSEKFLGTPRIEPAAAGLETRTLPLCYAAPPPTFIIAWPSS